MMSKWQKWTDDERDLLGILIKDGLNNFEIAEIIGRPRDAIAIKSQQWFGGNPNYLNIKAKYRKLHEPVARYFVGHSVKETCKHFSISEKQFKNIMSYVYAHRSDLKHLRKETRRHDTWTADEYRFLLQHSGLMPRNWIAKKLNRGGELGIKDRLEKLGVSSKNLNGLTKSQFVEAFGQEPGLSLQTKAGPGYGKYSPTFFRIVPWVWIRHELELKRLTTNNLMKDLVITMAEFQEWIYGGNVILKMKRICK